MDSQHLKADLIRRWLNGTVDHWTFLKVMLPHLIEHCPDCNRAWTSAIRGRIPGGGLVQDLQMEGVREGLTSEEAIRAALDRVLAEKSEILREERTDSTLQSMEALMELPPEERVAVIDRSRTRFSSPQLASRLLEESLSSASRDPEESETLAKLAQAVASRTQKGRSSRAIGLDLEAMAIALQANARRLLGEFHDARAMLELARRELDSGSGDPIVFADILSLEGSLLMDLRQFSEAERTARRAVKLYRLCESDHKAGRALMLLSLIQSRMGDPGKAVASLRDAMSNLDFEKEPQLRLKATANLALYVAEAGDPHQGLEILREIPTDTWRSRRSGLIRDWIEAQIFCLLGEDARATGAMSVLRDEFARLGDAPNTALASVELALLFAQQGLPREVRRVAEESFPLLQRLAIPQAVWATLMLFKQAADAENAGLELLQEIRDAVKDPRRWRGRVLKN